MHLRFMLPSYPWTRALEEGRVQIPGVTYECAPFIENAPDRFDAFSSGGFDVGEDSVRRFVELRLERGPANALPVFFDREHMQRNVFVRADSPLMHPRDLASKHVGTRQTLQSGTCAGVLMMLEQGYGLPLSAVKWHSRDPRSGSGMGLDVTLGPGTDEENLERVLKGELDAFISNLEGRYWSLFGPDVLDHEVSLPPGIKPLVASPSTIAETYRRTKLYPITDVVVVRPQLLEEHPELPAALMQAFTEAHALASDYRSGIEQHLADMEIEMLGEDPHVPGFNANAEKNIAVFLDLLHRLGGLPRTMPPAELFHPATRA